MLLSGPMAWAGGISLSLIKWAEWVALSLLPILTAVRTQYSRPTQPAGLGEFILLAIHDRYVLAVGILSVIVIIAKASEVLIGSAAKMRVKAVLDTLDQACFGEIPEGERYYNRITLFKAKWGKTLLKAYCRAGTQYQRGIQPFRIHDNQENQNEGVTGQAWFRNATVAVDHLPECKVPCSPTDPTCQEYARRGFIPLAKVRRVRVRSLSLVATPVRNLKGDKWGVLVVDMRKPEGLDPTKKTLVTSLAAALGKIL